MSRSGSLDKGNGGEETVAGHYSVNSLCGAVSGVVTRCAVQPLDVIKIRFQLQLEPITKVKSSTQTSTYHGLWQALGRVSREEGLTAMWKGHVPAQVLSVVYGAVQFLAFEASTKLCRNNLPDYFNTQWKPVTHFLCGGFAGCAATISCQPLDVLRTRLVAQGEPKTYKSLLDAVWKMYSAEGFTSFYKGLSPTLLQIFPQTGLQFGFYTSFKSIWQKFLSSEHSKQSVFFSESITCGALAGICSKTAIYPLDMIKKRLQVQGFEKARVKFGKVSHYSGVIHCTSTVMKEEGYLALFKGLNPSLIKAAISTALIFVTYETCCNKLKKSTALS